MFESGESDYCRKNKPKESKHILKRKDEINLLFSFCFNYSIFPALNHTSLQGKVKPVKLSNLFKQFAIRDTN